MQKGKLMDHRCGLRSYARICLLVSAPIFAAGDAIAGDTKKQIEFFLGTCFGALDDISRVKSLATLLKWQKSPSDFANLGKPVDGNGYESWVVRKEGELYAVAVNQAPWNDKQIANVCSIVVQSSRDEVIAELLRAVKLKKVHEEDEPLQTTYYYQYDSMAVERAMVSVIALKNGGAPVSLGITGIKNKR
jgi:hypothetical protein